MKIKTFIFFMLLPISMLNAQIAINAEPELLCKIPVGKGDNEVYCYTCYDDVMKVESIIVLQDGTLFFPTNYYDENNKYHHFVYKNGKFLKTDFLNTIEFRTMKSVNFYGKTMNNTIVYDFSNYNELNLKDISKKYSSNLISRITIVPEGYVLELDPAKINQSRLIIGLVVNNNIVTKEILDIDEINNWLKMQKGDFSIDKEHKCVLKNGFKWSSNDGIRPDAKLITGHDIEETMGISIYDINGNNVMKVNNTLLSRRKPYCFGIGPWGEIYYLVYPELEVIDDCGQLEAKSGEAELVVVRNHLKYFGVLTDDRIRLRSEPTTSSESLGTYPINTGFMILEKGTKQETIGGDTGVWYKVRLLDGKEGWFFGAYVRDLYDGPGTPLPWPNVADWN